MYKGVFYGGVLVIKTLVRQVNGRVLTHKFSNGDHDDSKAGLIYYYTRLNSTRWIFFLLSKSSTWWIFFLHQVELLFNEKKLHLVEFNLV